MTKPYKHPSTPPVQVLKPGVMSPHLDLQVSYRFGVPLIYVSGELDHYSVDQLREFIDQEMAAEPSALLLELSKLGYVDSGGLSLIFDVERRLKDGGWLGIVSPSPNVRRLLEMTGFSDRQGFRIIEDLGSVSTAMGTALG